MTHRGFLLGERGETSVPNRSGRRPFELTCRCDSRVCSDYRLVVEVLSARNPAKKNSRNAAVFTSSREYEQLVAPIGTD